MSTINATYLLCAHQNHNFRNVRRLFVAVLFILGVLSPSAVRADATVTLQNMTASAIQFRLQDADGNTSLTGTLLARQARTYNVRGRDRRAYLTWVGTDVRGEPLAHLGRYTLNAGGRVALATTVPQPQPQPQPAAAANHRVIWEYNGGSFARLSGGYWYERGQNGYERQYRETARTPTFVEIEAIDGSNIRFRLLPDRCLWMTPQARGWEERARGRWQPDRRSVWVFHTGRFVLRGAGVWVETQPSYRREYRETDRCRDYVELMATDASGIGFRLYANGVCYMRTPAADWHEGARGNWNY